MDKLTNYRNRIKELTDELHHYVHEYEKLILKEEKQKKTSCQYKEEKRRKSYQKEQSS